jgi:hypothetical protein
LNLLANVDVVLDIFKGCVLGQLLQELTDFFFSGFHVSEPPGTYIVPRFGLVWDILSAYFQCPDNVGAQPTAELAG